MTTPDVDLATRVASVRLESGELRWPELSMACDCDKGVIHLWNSMTLMPLGDRPCSDCHGTGRVPNVTLETMCAVLQRLSGEVQVAFVDGEATALIETGPDDEDGIFMGDGPNAEVAVLHATGAWLDILEATP